MNSTITLSHPARMLKRKPSADLERPHSVYDGDPTQRHNRRKRLFVSRNHDKPVRPPKREPAMTELLEYILQHEEAFKNQYRLSSLYADFRQQLEINPEGYQANISAWTKALTNAARAGVIPTQGTTHDLLRIRTADELARALQHPQYGKPTCLPAVFHEAVQKKEMIPLKEFLNSRESIYKTSWIPSPWKVVQWGLRQVGVLGQPKLADKLGAGDFVVLKNTEIAADEILKKMKEHTSTADRVLSRAEFTQRFANTLTPTAPLTQTDINILLVHLSRDKQAISYTSQTIKFKPEHEIIPEPITQEDEAIANLRDTLSNINAQIPPLLEEITLADAAAREAVATKQIVRAKAALRSKKLAESALAQRSDVALQLEAVYTKLREAADQVEIVAAMRAGADALRSLNEKVGGAEGVQGVVDAVNEQMAIGEEISGVIGEDGQVDEGEIDGELEELERVEREKEEAREAKGTAKRLAELEGLEKRREREKEREVRGRMEREKENVRMENEGDVVGQKKVQRVDKTEVEETEKKIEEASQDLAKLSFVQQPEDEEMQDADGKNRVPLSA